MSCLKLASDLFFFYATSSDWKVVYFVQTLAQHVTVGLADSVSKISGSISNGLGKATMDHDFQVSRERRLASAKVFSYFFACDNS